MPFVTSEPKKINVEDVQFSSSVSEAVANKIAAGTNYILDYFTRYEFGVTGGVYSGLVMPYTFSGTMENLKSACVITDIEVFNEISGISGTTTFRIERQLAAGGAWTTIFATDCSIINTAADNLFFNMNGSAPAGVTLPTLSISTFAKNDKLRWVLTSVADQAQNISIVVYTRPI